MTDPRSIDGIIPLDLELKKRAFIGDGLDREAVNGIDRRGDGRGSRRYLHANSPVASVDTSVRPSRSA
jgi:hypothetical protein